MPRVRPHFKLHVSARIHPKWAELWDDNDAVAAYARLGVHAVEAFASKTDGRFIVRARTLVELAGTESLGEACSLFDRMAKAGLFRFASAGRKAYEFEWPKLAEKQGFVHQELRRNARRSGTGADHKLPGKSTSESESESESDTETDTEAPTRRRGRAPHAFPASVKEKQVLLEAIGPWAKRKGFTFEQLSYALVTVRDWAAGKNARRSDWAAVVRNAMRDGWALKGYEAKGEAAKFKGTAGRYDEDGRTIR